MQQYFSLADCEVMGFDLDHTLCRYHLPQSAAVSTSTARSQSQGCPLRVSPALGLWEGMRSLPASGEVRGNVPRGKEGSNLSYRADKRNRQSSV